MFGVCCSFHEGSGTSSDKKRIKKVPAGPADLSACYFSFVFVGLLTHFYNFTTSRAVGVRIGKVTVDSSTPGKV